MPVRVYYEDTDAGGVLYHAALIRYLDRARAEWLREEGYSLAQVARDEHRVFAVRELTVRYLKSGYHDEALTVHTEPVANGPASLDFEQSVWRDEECLANATVRLACVDTKTGRPVAMPESIRMKVEK